jgi:hypothetical protein
MNDLKSKFSLYQVLSLIEFANIHFFDCAASRISFFLSINMLESLQGKGKAIPLQALTGPEGSRRLRLPHFNTIDT